MPMRRKSIKSRKSVRGGKNKGRTARRRRSVKRVTGGLKYYLEPPPPRPSESSGKTIREYYARLITNTPILLLANESFDSMTISDMATEYNEEPEIINLINYYVNIAKAVESDLDARNMEINANGFKKAFDAEILLHPPPSEFRLTN